MKRMIFAVAAMLSMTMAFADNENTNSVNNAEAYNMNINMNMLSRALDLTGDQKASVADIHKVFCAEMGFAGQSSKEERGTMMNKAINKDLAYMHTVLNEEQYKKYVMLLNATMVNRGLK